MVQKATVACGEPLPSYDVQCSVNIIKHIENTSVYFLFICLFITSLNRQANLIPKGKDHGYEHTSFSPVLIRSSTYL